MLQINMDFGQSFIKILTFPVLFSIKRWSCPFSFQTLQSAFNVDTGKMDSEMIQDSDLTHDLSWAFIFSYNGSFQW